MFLDYKMTPYNCDMPKGRPSESPRTEFGARLFELREKRGFTQSQVAETLGVTVRAYAFWERKTVALRADQIAQLSELLNVSADELVGRTPRKAKRNGPKGKLETLFEAASELPRRQQQRIAEVVEDILTAQKTKAS